MFFGFPVTRLSYLALVRSLVQSGGMTPALALGSVREANEMPLSLATELLRLMSHSLREILPEEDTGAGSRSDSQRRVSITDLFHRGGGRRR